MHDHKLYILLKQRNKTKLAFHFKYLLIYKLNSLTLTNSITENFTKQLRGFNNPLQISKLGTFDKTFYNFKTTSDGRIQLTSLQSLEGIGEGF